MAITQPSKRSKADAFAEGAPDAKREGPKLRGKRQPIAFTLPPEVLRGFVRDYRRESAKEAA